MDVKRFLHSKLNTSTASNVSSTNAQQPSIKDEELADSRDNREAMKAEFLLNTSEDSKTDLYNFTSSYEKPSADHALFHMRQKSCNARIDHHANWSMSSFDGASHSQQPSGVASREHDFSSLPAAWSVGKTNEGRIYFIDETNKLTTWLDPRTAKPHPGICTQPGEHTEPFDEAKVAGSEHLPELPKGWEMVTSEHENMPYFVDHINKITTWQDPRVDESGNIKCSCAHTREHGSKASHAQRAHDHRTSYSHAHGSRAYGNSLLHSHRHAHRQYSSAEGNLLNSRLQRLDIDSPAFSARRQHLERVQRRRQSHLHSAESPAHSPSQMVGAPYSPVPLPPPVSQDGPTSHSRASNLRSSSSPAPDDSRFHHIKEDNPYLVASKTSATRPDSAEFNPHRRAPPATYTLHSASLSLPDYASSRHGLRHGPIHEDAKIAQHRYHRSMHDEGYRSYPHMPHHLYPLDEHPSDLLLSSTSPSSYFAARSPGNTLWERRSATSDPMSMSQDDYVSSLFEDSILGGPISQEGLPPVDDSLQADHTLGDATEWMALGQHQHGHNGDDLNTSLEKLQRDQRLGISHRRRHRMHSGGVPYGPGVGVTTATSLVNGKKVASSQYSQHVSSLQKHNSNLHPLDVRRKVALDRSVDEPSSQPLSEGPNGDGASNATGNLTIESDVFEYTDPILQMDTQATPLHHQQQHNPHHQQQQQPHHFQSMSGPAMDEFSPMSRSPILGPMSPDLLSLGNPADTLTFDDEFGTLC